jgi:hypothetical protein
MSKYAEKFYFNATNEISDIAKKIKANNDKYLELLILSPVPQVVETAEQ